MKIYDPKLEPRSKLGHENHEALDPENSADSEHYGLVQDCSNSIAYALELLQSCQQSNFCR